MSENDTWARTVELTLRRTPSKVITPPTLASAEKHVRSVNPPVETLDELSPPGQLAVVSVVDSAVSVIVSVLVAITVVELVTDCSSETPLEACGVVEFGMESAPLEVGVVTKSVSEPDVAELLELVLLAPEGRATPAIRMAAIAATTRIRITAIVSVGRT